MFPRIHCLLLLLAQVVALPAQDVPRHDARTFYDTTSVRGASFSADGDWILFTSDETGVFNAWRTPIAGGKAEQLTRSETNAISTIGYFPGDDRFLYTADVGGDELNHLYVQYPWDAVTDLTPGEGLKASFVRWGSDDRTFYLLTNERDPQFFDLYRYEFESVPEDDLTGSYPRSLMFENDQGYQVADVSPDGRWVALGKVHSNVDSDVYVWDSQHPEQPPVHITPHEGHATHSVAGFTPDSAKLCYSTDAHGEFATVLAYELASGEQSTVAEADWDVSGVQFSRDGRYRVVTVNVDARTVVEVTDLAENRVVELPAIPRGDVRGIRFARDSGKIAFYVNGDTQPSNLFVADLREGTHRQLTEAGNPAIDPAHLVESEVVRFPSFDGLEIPALLYRPHAAGPDNKVPALLWIHGGPGGQSRTGYRADLQHLVNHGYAILAVNNRGSSGYGKTFFHMDDKRHGDVDLKDCIWGRRYLEGLDWVDGERVGIMGGSYGGYMVAAALAFEPDAFDIGIDIFGVTNWLRTLKSIPPWWTGFRDALYSEMGDPVVEEARLTAISPLFHADQIRVPLLVVQGANDPRVLQVESDELVAKVRANGVPVAYVLFEDEGHGFRKRDNRVEASEAWLAFANHFLRDGRKDAFEWQYAPESEDARSLRDLTEKLGVGKD